VEGKGGVGRHSIRHARWSFVSDRLDHGGARERRDMDAQVPWVLCLLASFSASNLVFYERVSFYLEDHYLFLFGVLYYGRPVVEVG
tara:strand:- start:242 stop:499 length:258 start_codon:yes stop_codon:yes gene_type:complete